MSEIADLFDLTGKWALVTGARGGLGQAMARALAMAGADIVGLGSTPMPETGQLIEASGRRFLGVQADLSQPNDFRALVAQMEELAGPIDILVNNAGIIRRADVLDYTEADWDVVTNVNEKNLFFLSQAVARGMVSRRFGRIINIASLLSFQGGIRVPAYTASKHAVAGLTKLMANELAASGVTVNAIAPGYMETDNTAALRADPDRQRQILERIPMGRWGVPDDLATAVLFLATPRASYVTGAIIPVDGGWLAR
ncbi:2-dehydro-3-deoxy-D-gluconate 5-dehydrogenase KduD [Ensifer sp. HO-A22]|uniref:2-dehydro-3-deoxy-D-gluconate 5-dehydrogenase KduD n=1 Tax=Ensifer oleiphilus TaxID=2742698 RepID=A0A7Y6UPU4_9HYPH|nr:2-dehydro-3-deoxy-D-gluconate 5-dehydrogenase KduD [Ensifer oleiphilus]NVD41836.1 2-dehydro-3-deoxy-D-gluconate 5-dehydrogenase KduD [Ensifer oleiphilus]